MRQEITAALIGVVMEQGQELNGLDKRVEVFEVEMFSRTELFQKRTAVSRSYGCLMGKILPNALASHKISVPKPLSATYVCTIYGQWPVKKTA
jgi:hypothetical protein